jgi:phosphoglycolate phosphatase
MSEKSSTTNLIIFDWEGTLGDCNALLPGIRETLHTLQTQGYELAIATSMGKAGLEDYLTSENIASFFSCCQTSDMGYSKPDPKMLQEILDQTGRETSETIMVGDCLYDMVMATDANIQGIGVLTGMDNAESLQYKMPHVVILESVAELPAFLSPTQTVLPTAQNVH